jgi:hypothetical protein
MRERSGVVATMERSPGSAEASERIEGLVDEMQRWVQSGELRMKKGQEEWKKPRDTQQQGSPAAAVLQDTPHRQSASPFNTGDRPQGLFMPDRSACEFAQYDRQQGQPSSGRPRSDTPRQASDLVEELRSQMCANEDNGNGQEVVPMSRKYTCS